MVYIPWEHYGICKYWMLQRCYSGAECKWEHPEPKERKRLWDSKTAEQDAECANGVERPVNPGLDKLEARRARDVEAERERREKAALPSSLYKTWPTSRETSAPPPPAPPPSQKRKLKWDVVESDTSELPAAFTAGGGEELEEGELPRTSLEEVLVPRSPEPPAAKRSRMCGPQHLTHLLDGHIDETSPADRHHHPQLCTSESTMRGRAASAGQREEAVTSGCEMAIARDAAVTGAERAGSALPPQNEYWKQYRSRRHATGSKRGEQKGVQPAEATKVSAKPTRASTSSTSTSTHSRPTARLSLTSPPTTASNMGATKRMANGEVKHVGPHPSTIRVSARYASQAAVDKKLQPQPVTSTQAAPDVQERLTAEAREDSIRLQGCRWLDDVRRQMQLPIRTFTTACTYYHRFRLAHPQHVAGMEYGNAWVDACAASLLTACKVEDTLKKSKDILAAAHNLRAATTGGEQVGTDDPMFEAPSRVVIGLERLVLEAGSFDFRSKYPHELMVKIGKTLEGAEDEKRAITALAWSVLTDLHRTFAPLKQTSASMAIASLELASHLYAAGTANDSSAVRDSFTEFNFEKHSTSREEAMETILDALDLYTHHTLQTLLGSKYSLDDYLRIRLAFNKECSENTLPRFTLASPRDNEQEPNGNTLRVQNGHPTPVSPPQPESQTQNQPQANGQPSADGGTLRFMLNPQLAADEKSEVQKFFVEEWEEYEEEIEVPLPRASSPDRRSDRSDRRPPLTGPPRAPPPPGPPRGDYRGPPRYDDRRPPRYDDRRYDDRRYDDRRVGRYDDRRYDDRRRERR